MDQDIPFERIGGYRILRRLATGGTSDVLLARAEGPHGFERTVVLKLLLQQFRRDAPMEKMFAREAAAYARLSHPAIVKLYDFFSAEGQLVMVLEFIDGLPLNRFRAMLRKNGEQVDDRASIFVASRVFAALAAAHGARDPESGEFAPVIHRDVNPSNILIPWDGHVKLADFGIAKVAGVSSDTQAGFIKGTYGYMAPEQVRGEPVTVRTDVYAASLLLWELLARRKAIQRGALPEIEVLRAMAEPSLPSLDVLRPDLPLRLREAITRGLEPAPDSRSVTAEEMLMVLRESVTSNEGRNVLAETLARVRQEAEVSRSGPPPQVAPDPTPKPPQAAPRPPPRVQSEASIDGRARTALGTGQVSAVSPGALSGRDAPPPTSRGAQPRGAAPALRPVATMAFGIPREGEPVRTGSRPEEGAGAYSSVASAGRPATEERTATLGFGAHVLAPPAGANGDSLPPVLGGGGASSAPTDSLPPALGFGAPAKPNPGPIPVPPPPRAMYADSLPPVLGPAPPPPPPLPPFHRPMFPEAPTADEAPATAPMPLPFTTRSTPPPSAPQPPALPPPNLFAPPPVPAAAPIPVPVIPSQPPPQLVTNSPGALLASTLASAQPRLTPLPLPGSAPATPFPTRSLTPAGLESSKTGTYVLLAGLALTASAAVVAALLIMQKAPPGAPSAKTSVATATTAAPQVKAAPAATPAPAPTPVATPAPTPTPAAATAAPPLPAATPAATPPSPAPAAGAVTSTSGSIPATDGEIVTPAKAGGHRIFVDGRYAGDSPGPIRVHCGAHSVKIGSSGAPHAVTVPCGGQLTVAR